MKKTRFVLKARKDGTWEDIEEYDEKKSLADISDEVDDLKDEGYDYVRFEEVDQYGRKVKLHWAKKLKPPQKVINKTLEEMKQYTETLKAMKEALGIREQDPIESVAGIVSLMETFRKVCDAYPQLCGKEVGTGDKFLDRLLQAILESRLKVNIPPPQPQPQLPQAQSTPQLPPPSPEVIQKINNIVKESVDKATSLVTTECQALGTCLENEEPKETESEVEGEELAGSD